MTDVATRVRTWDYEVRVRTVNETKSGDGSEILSGAARVFQVTLVASPAAAEPAIVTLDARPLTIGREPEGARTLALADERASRSHATIAYDERGDSWSVRDLQSRNGLFVDGARVDTAPLRHGTVLRIGQSLLVCSDARLAEDERLAPETPALLGGSLAMRRVRGEIERVAPRPVPVMVVGETGTGKECVARELHRLSRRTGPFVGVNCAAIPEALAESELFGHGVGAFTGATQRAEGLFVAADRGTLFLDEVAELPAAVQAKLLRALATREVRALGQNVARPIDVRVVSASPRDLQGGGSFREDLFARLAVWTIRLPPLRERRDDVLPLARAFSDREPKAPPLSTSAAEALLLYGWPRNVRELEAVLTAAAIRAGDARVLRCEHLPDAIGARVSSRAGAAPARAPLELLVPPGGTPSAGDLRLVLERFGGSVALVAKYFAKDRRQVYRWLERAGIEPDAYRRADDEAD